MSACKTTPAELLCEFFEVVIHNIVHAGRLYPETIFAKKKKYGIPVYQCIHPDVNEYINRCLQAINFHSRKNQLSRLFVCFHEKDRICERYVFDVLRLKNSAECDPLLVELEQSMRNFILKLHSAQAYLEDLSDDATFSISIQTTAYSSVDFNQEPTYEDFPWIEVKENEVTVSGAEIVPLHTLETDCLTLQMYIEREAMDEAETGVKRKSRLAVFEHVEIEKAQKKVKFKSNTSEYEESSSSETELVIDEKKNSGKKKKKSPLIKLSKEPLNLRCEWRLCEEYYDSWEEFNSHLMDHAASNSERLTCQWANCDHNTTTVPLLMQHLSYHGYISKIINIGKNVVERHSLPKCYQNEVSNIPMETFGYTCEWEDCSHNFCTIYEFFHHMLSHVKKKPTIPMESENEAMRCCWAGCEKNKSKLANLTEHLRTHTKEKIIGCPTCFTIFSSKTKFCDHRRRQQSSFIQSYQCSQCLKLFPSERLLRDHIRSHINHYKCTMCDMTCTKPSLLAKHIRFKHVKYKPYKCPECDKTFVAKHNLDTHMKIHEKNNPMKCDVCDFSCRTRVGLDNHYVKKHEASGLCYECHCCKKKFKRGGYLTKHLTNLHNYHWPSGHSRFKYRKDQDGIYRLQTVRLESLEVTQEVIRSESMPTSKVEEGVRYLLNYDNGKTGYVLSISETNEQTLKPADKDTVKENKVLITIQDVDKDGNVLKSQIVKSEIVDELPLLDNAMVVGGVNDKDTAECSSSFNKSTDSGTYESKTCYSDSENVDDPRNTKSIYKTESQTEEQDCFPEEPTILNYEMFKKELSSTSGA